MRASFKNNLIQRSLVSAEVESYDIKHISILEKPAFITPASVGQFCHPWVHPA